MYMTIQTKYKEQLVLKTLQITGCVRSSKFQEIQKNHVNEQI